jgi:hypothetical protein
MRGDTETPLPTPVPGGWWLATGAVVSTRSIRLLGAPETYAGGMDDGLAKSPLKPDKTIR